MTSGDCKSQINDEQKKIAMPSVYARALFEVFYAIVFFSSHLTPIRFDAQFL